MREEVRNRLEVLVLDEADRLGKLQIGSPEYHNCGTLITDLTKELISIDKNEIQKEIENEKLNFEKKSRNCDNFHKDSESENQEKRSKREFWGRIGVAAISIIVPVVCAVIESKGVFIKTNTLKPVKF